MRLSTLRTLLLTTAATTLSQARITGISAPATLAPNETFTLTLISTSYIQSVADVAVAWGFDVAPGYPGILGSFTDSAYLGPCLSNQAENISISATVPAGLSTEFYRGKDLLLNAGVYSLYGASGEPVTSGFNVTVRIANETSCEDAASSQRAWVQNSECV
ncbi:hypothetical protein BDW02DRAFT_649940 [Decorospora gaudefroyi]|uniref:Uncharacterized protein n=1 Tax=Decorospora gaudefroyi TaxID=184978 RepID=A0A6A5K8U9_9PLEO|nr:hypothetical protein BDW02DRAFT_649940 [Decorospora gaudefroyi]